MLAIAFLPLCRVIQVITCNSTLGSFFYLLIDLSTTYLPSFLFIFLFGFPDNSVGKESSCNAGDPSSIPGSGRSTEEGIGYPLQYSWASLVSHLVKSLSAMQETWVQSLSSEDPPGEGKGYPFQYSGLENSMDCIAHGVTKSQTQLNDFHFLSQLSI